MKDFNDLNDLDIKFSPSGIAKNAPKSTPPAPSPQKDDDEDLNFSLNEQGEHIFSLKKQSENIKPQDKAKDSTFDGSAAAENLTEKPSDSLADSESDAGLDGYDYGDEFELYRKDAPDDKPVSETSETPSEIQLEEHAAAQAADLMEQIAELEQLEDELQHTGASDRLAEIETEPEVEAEIEPEVEIEAETSKNVIDEIVNDVMSEMASDEGTSLEVDSKTPSEEDNLSPEMAAIMPLMENGEQESASVSDVKLKGMSKEVTAVKYDLINLAVIGFILLFIGVTFIFMNSSLGAADSEKLSLESLRTGSFTLALSEQYTSDMPLEETMENLNVIMHNIFGKSDLEFKKKLPVLSSDGPVEFEGGDMSVDNSDELQTTTSATETTAPVSTTEKVPQNFSVSRVESDSENGDGLFTGRPIDFTTTTTIVTTQLDLPRGTESSTTGSVQLVIPGSTN